MKTDKPALAKLTETSLVDLYVKATALAGGETRQGPYYHWTINPFSVYYSSVFGLTIPAAQTDLVLNDLAHAIQQGRVPRHVLTGPASLPEDIEQHLPAHGFTVNFRQIGMAMDLTAPMRNTGTPAFPPDRIDTGREVSAWAETADRAFNRTRDPEMYQRLAREDDIRLYACRDQATIVATTMLHIKDSVAGIHMVGTLPEYRGRGLGTALTIKALTDARALGCTLGVLQASAMGKSIYQKNGFAEYGTITHWEFPEDRSTV